MKRYLFFLAMFSLIFGSASGGPADPAPVVEGCPVLPANNIWNMRVDGAPLDEYSSAYVESIGPDQGLHADFGSGLWEGGPIGIPVTVVDSGTAKVPVSFDYADESDPGPYPLPAAPLIEGGSDSTGDRHILLLDSDACVLYELYYAWPPAGEQGWTAGSGAIFDLNSNVLRPQTWTSADAAGLPIFPGLVRYDEVAAGRIEHAIRFTAQVTRKEFTWPARHQAGSTTAWYVPPMGQRFRLKADYDISGFPPQARVVLQALKEYGMILADNGSDWFLSGVPDERWDNDDLAHLRDVPGSAFEAVNVMSYQVSPDSGEYHDIHIQPVIWLPFVTRK